MVSQTTVWEVRILAIDLVFIQMKVEDYQDLQALRVSASGPQSPSVGSSLLQIGGNCSCTQGPAHTA